MSTIKDVALYANVSISTVSKVFNNYSSVSDATRRKVLKAAKAVNYIPNKHASELSKKNAASISIFVKDTKFHLSKNNNINSYLSGAIDYMIRNNIDYQIVFEDYLKKNILKSNIESYMKSINSDSAVFFGFEPEPDDFFLYNLVKSDSINCVITDYPLTRTKTSCIIIDQAKAQYDIAMTILKQNDKVLYLTENIDDYIYRARLSGMYKAAKDINADLDVVFCEFRNNLSYETVMSRGKVYDSYVCANDYLAMGARKATYDLDYQESRVSGFDYTELSKYLLTDLFSVERDLDSCGANAIKEIINLRNGARGRMIVDRYTIIKNK
ncbi:MAG: LacI family DNA-binding transcriptional regulator [Erysipelotrichaceae bacterium]|nr:LacI family DNA-binding transcriptional regulator [Erysipelotrichaceae bacterium]